ncbi:CorA family divalent cation transporter [Methanosphaera sp.]|uniref:magnesium transporter CorA family protein n=1 Tax=Methanosphaera sp. TaxID=2666342 RepID=UPI0025D4BB3A|nr:CorA family divalent cation transporter [Methanosphaera sp.]MEE1118144.1 CorA family divalent cation transporter [Methanosphaera sp.]MEE3324458.1 CorA family divalent cation transporter [Methanosphaera sp.]MEE3418631.1 CorA family divalent cation transporter [Methanosphaera sp.]
MYYIISEKLLECTKEEMIESKKQYVALLSSEAWEKEKNTFKMGIDFEPKTTNIHVTKAEENFDSITGTFFIPNRKNVQSEEIKFAFALDEKGIVFIDDTLESRKIVRRIKKRKKWRLPSLERFIYDFLNEIIKDDFRMMEKYEQELDEMEDEIIYDDELISQRVNDIRVDIRDLKKHYEQLLDLGEVFEENENRFFREENLRYFRMFINRVERLRDLSNSIRDYTIQLRDVYKTHLDIKQNHIMTLLTMVTTVFTPLMLVVGWYGMNFKYMPELEYRMSYPLVFASCIAISLLVLWFFRRKKWL